LSLLLTLKLDAVTIESPAVNRVRAACAVAQTKQQSGDAMDMESAYVVRDGVAIVSFDNPPVNSLSAAQRKRLHE
jgi:hypothetical protein